MNHILTVAMFCMILLAGPICFPAGAVQICKDSIPASSPGGFTLNSDGTVTHKTTGLMWMRCALGQEWDGETCRGTASSFIWAEALKAGVLQKFAGYEDWRLPNKNELESIIEERCVVPAINADVFPATPSAFFWSASPYTGVKNGAWSVDFGYGAVNASVKNGKIFVRLVRDVE
jgi:Protein of unknown function (DUF1566)